MKVRFNAVMTGIIFGVWIVWGLYLAAVFFNGTPS